MQTVNDIISETGAAYIKRSCQVSEYSIRAARRDGVFPSSWYEAIKGECDRLGVDCPTDLFSFKRSSNPTGPADAA
jgi:hypothetical protein